MLEKRWDRQTDERTDARPLHYAYAYARHGLSVIDWERSRLVRHNDNAAASNAEINRFWNFTARCVVFAASFRTRCEWPHLIQRVWLRRRHTSPARVDMRRCRALRCGADPVWPRLNSSVPFLQKEVWALSVPKASTGLGIGSRLGGLGSVVSSPSGIRDVAPDETEFCKIWMPKKPPGSTCFIEFSAIIL